MTKTTEPRNASELHFLTVATAGAPTLAHRLEHLAAVHAQGQTLPDTTATPEARAAWEKHQAQA